MTLAIDPARRRAHLHGQRLELGGRAFDLLLALAAKPGEFIGADQLLASVWPGRDMAAGNLRAQVLRLRQRMGLESIEAIPGRGYRLTLPVRQDEPAAPRLVGRDAESALLAQRAAQHELVTVCGAGGIGKTALVRNWYDKLPIGPGSAKAWADLSGASAASLPAVLAEALGLGGAARAWSAASLAAALAEAPPPRRRLHLVLDNAEHLVPALAPVLQALLAARAGLQVVVTSQLPLKLPQEGLLRLGPLDLPEPGDSAQQALQHAAVQLFVARVKALRPGYTLDDSQAAPVVALCRALDGTPLALELAAARVPAFGVHALAQTLHERLRLLASPAHSRPGRQQTLRAALQWTCQCLDAPARTVFERLGVFLGPFTLQGATAVVADVPSAAPQAAGTPIDSVVLTEAIATLVDASLLVPLPEADSQAAQAAPGAPRWRLLDTPRLYALQQLQEGGHLGALRRRHLAWCLGWVQDASPLQLAQGQAELQAALDWALSGGDAEGGAALARHLDGHPGLAALRAHSQHTPQADSLPQLLQRLNAAGLTQRAEQAGLHRQSLLAMAHRLGTAELRSVDDALLELQQAVDVARSALAAQDADPAIDAYVEGVLAEVVEHTRLGEFDLGSERIDDALAEVERRTARLLQRLQRSQRALLASGLQQDLLRRDADAVARRTEALLALDGAQPTQGAAWRAHEAQAMATARDGAGTLWLEIAAALAQRRLTAAPTAAARADARLALAQALSVHGDRSNDIERLSQAARACSDALAELPATAAESADGHSELRGALLHQLAEAQLLQGQRQSDTALLQSGLQHAEAALRLRPRAQQPQAWATTQLVHGELLRCLGMLELGPQRVQAAATALRAALDELDADSQPLQRARALNALGIALSVLASRQNDPLGHREALAVQQAALALVPRERAAALWGRICNNIGLELSMIAGAGHEPEAHWRDAIEAFERALGVITREAVPVTWARLQHNLGSCLSHLGNRQSDPALLARAVQAFRAALLEHGREQQPLVWSATASELAATLYRLGHLTPGPEGRSAIEQSLEWLNETLTVRRRDNMPREWVRNMNDLRCAQLRLGQHSGEVQWVRTALEGARWMHVQPELADMPQEREMCELVLTEASDWLVSRAAAAG